MRRELEKKAYHTANHYDAPAGITTQNIDPHSGQPATAACPTRRQEVFIAGTQPLDSCRLHGGGQPGVTRVAGWDTQPPQPTSVAPPSSLPPTPMVTGGRPKIVNGDAPPAAAAPNTEQSDH